MSCLQYEDYISGVTHGQAHYFKIENDIWTICECSLRSINWLKTVLNFVSGRCKFTLQILLTSSISSQSSTFWCLSPFKIPLFLQKRLWVPFHFHFHFHFLLLLLNFCLQWPLPFIHLHQLRYFLYFIKLCNDKVFLDKFTLTNLDIKDFWWWVFEEKCEIALK